MKLSAKLVLVFSTSFTLLLGVALWCISVLFDQYRQQEFTERLRQQTLATFQLLIEAQQINTDLVKALDRKNIGNLQNEEVLLFDSSDNCLYSNKQDHRLYFSKQLLHRLHSTSQIVSVDEDWDVYACRINNNGTIYYGMARAYDTYGRSKLEYLQFILILIFCIGIVVNGLATFIIARRVTTSILKLSTEIKESANTNQLLPVTVPNTRDEINHLAKTYNQLLQQLNRSMMYQKNFIHHVSHELKTPIAVLIANLEKHQLSNTAAEAIDFQKDGLKQLADIINTLLELARMDDQSLARDQFAVRIDEILFECIDYISIIDNEAQFELNVSSTICSDSQTTISGNERMLKIMLINMLRNSLNYSENHRTKVNIEQGNQSVQIIIQNSGQTLSSDDVTHLFTHFFRGENARNTKGTGLGLVLCKKIVEYHNGTIVYRVSEQQLNEFVIEIPLFRIKSDL